MKDFLEEIKQITELRKKEKLTEEEIIKREILRKAEQGENICFIVDEIDEDSKAIEKIKEQGFNVTFKYDDIFRETTCIISW